MESEVTWMDVDDKASTRTLCDDYIVGAMLGSGGFSAVHQGVSKEDGSEVAIKTLKKPGIGLEELYRQGSSGRGMEVGRNPNPGPGFGRPQELFISEALVANEIVVMRKIVEDVSPHPNVIHLLDVFEDAACVHLVLELCAGGELFDRIVSQGRYSEAAAARVILQIASGLACLHEAKIVHRDLKPENCLYLTPSENSTLKIMDFGLSYIDGVTSPIVGMFGSIDYVSPEALLQKSVVPASDMWSLGIILFILLCGYPPFRARTRGEKQKLILTGNFGKFGEDSWKDVSPSGKRLISGLLAVDPRSRPTAEDLRIHPWVIGEAAEKGLLDPNVFLRLQTFNARRKFRAAGFASILTSRCLLRTKHLRRLIGSRKILSPEEIHKLHSRFQQISSNGVNVTLFEFEDVLRAMEMSEFVPLAPRIFGLFDGNRDGCVDLREVVIGFSSLKKTEGDEGLKLCFQLYDTDGSGYISRDELTSMLRALPEDYLPDDITEPGKLDEMFELMDVNNDDRISFEEFRQAIHYNSFLQDAVLNQLRDSPGLNP